MRSGVARIIGLFLLAAVAVGCVKSLPREEPLGVAPVQFGERELREVSNIVIVTDASGTMWAEETFPRAKALSTSFIQALPDASARSASRDYNVGYIAFGGDDRVAVPLQSFDRRTLLAASEKAEIMGSVSGTGGMTPVHAVIDEIGKELEGKSGDTAVVLFSDGRPDDADRALATATAVSETYRGKLCFHTVQVGDSAEGGEFMRQLAGVTSCGSSQNSAGVATSGEFQRYAKNVIVGAAPLPAVAAAPPGSCAGKIRLRGIEFGFDKAAVDEAGSVVLDTAIEAISACSGARLNIDGHTDSVGTEAYNQTLSERRASAVKDYLVSKGIQSGRVTPKGFGESNPVAANDTSDGRARNRRVELTPLD